MSHELDMSLGFAAIALAADQPPAWHGLVNEYLTPDDTPETAVIKGGLNWSILRSPVEYRVGEEIHSFENKAVLYRSDTGAPLSVMSDSHYVPAQPIDLVRGLYEVIKGSGFVIDCIMSLRGGKVISALARRTAEPGELGDDIHLPYLGLLTSCDGTFARQANLTAIRRVCMNTVRFSLADSSTVTAKQRNSREFTIEKANDLFDKLGEFDKGFQNYMETMRAMAKVKMSDDRLKRFFAKLYAPQAFADENKWKNGGYDLGEVSAKRRNTVADVMNAYLDSPGANLPSADGTLYGAFNAVTYFQDHLAPTRENKRYESSALGQGASMKEKALELATSLI